MSKTQKHFRPSHIILVLIVAATFVYKINRKTPAPSVHKITPVSEVSKPNTTNSLTSLEKKDLGDKTKSSSPSAPPSASASAPAAVNLNYKSVSQTQTPSTPKSAPVEFNQVLELHAQTEANEDRFLHEGLNLSELEMQHFREINTQWKMARLKGISTSQPFENGNALDDEKAYRIHELIGSEKYARYVSFKEANDAPAIEALEAHLVAIAKCLIMRFGRDILSPTRIAGTVINIKLA
jgi:hypothetical protein